MGDAMRGLHMQNGGSLEARSVKYTWYMPDLLLAAQWAHRLWEQGGKRPAWGCRDLKEGWLRDLLRKPIPWEDKAALFGGTWLYTPSGERRTLAEARRTLAEAWVTEGFVLPGRAYAPGTHGLWDCFPGLGQLQEMVRGLAELPTGRGVEGNWWHMSEYVQAFLSGLVDRHLTDMIGMVDRHMGGMHRVYSVGSYFELHTKKYVPRCELGNLIHTGSVFGFDGGWEARMVPQVLHYGDRV
jgi:hypothetical protein